MAFDPNQPFTVDKQETAFDPSKPFEVEAAKPVASSAPPAQVTPPTPATPPPRYPDTFDMSGGVALPPSAMETSKHILAGVIDPAVGFTQLAAHVPIPLPGVTSILPFSKNEIDKWVKQYNESLKTQGTDWWRLVGNMASPINYFAPELGQGAGLVGRVGANALRGAGVGAMQPVEDVKDFVAKKLEQTGLGAATGAVLAPITEGIGALARWVMGSHGPEAVEDKAVQQILARIKKDEAGGGPTTQDMLDLINAAPGKPLTLADVGGENLQALVGKIQREPGEARQIITKFLQDRDLNAGLRLSEDVNQGIGKGSAYDTAQALAAARSKAARPKYEAAFSRIVPTQEEADRVGRFIHDPIGQDALQRGLRVIQLEDLAQGKTFNPADYGVGRGEDGKFVIEPDKVPNIRLMDAVKRGYDQIVEGFRNPTTGRLELDQYGRAVNLVRSTFTNDLREMYPRYAGALDAWGGPSQSIDALQAGRDFMKREPEEIAKRIASLSPNDREFYKLGAAATLRKLVATTGAQGDEARRIVGNAYTRSQLRPLFDSDEAYDKFINAVKAESQMFRTAVKTLGGSQTAAREAEDQGPDIGAIAHGVRGAMEVTHNPAWGAYNLLRAFGSKLKPKMSPEVASSAAKVLTGPPDVAINNLIAQMNGRQDPLLRQALPYLVPPAALATQPSR